MTVSLHLLSDSDLRTGCKEAIDALELWLRRIIDIALRPDFGDDYFNATDRGQCLFSKKYDAVLKTGVFNRH